MLIPYMIKNIEATFEWQILKKMLVFSIPLALSSLSAAILSSTDRFALKFINGFSDLGLYAFAQKIGNIISFFIVASVNLALWPTIYKLMNDPNNKRFYSKLKTYYSFILMFFVLGISFFGKEIVKVFASKTEYWDAYYLIPFIEFSGFFGMLKDVSLIGMQIAKRTGILASIITVMAGINLAFNLIFIYFFNSLGAAISILLTQILYFILIYRFSQKFYFIPYEIPKIIKVLFVGTVLLIAAMLLNPMNIIFRLLGKTILIILFPIFLYMLNFFDKIEIVAITNFWLKWKSISKLKENLNLLKKI
jgi:O-antigen/teichoic acid export membrane protein